MICQDDAATDATDAPAADPAADAGAGRSLDKEVQIFFKLAYIALYPPLREAIMPK